MKRLCFIVLMASSIIFTKPPSLKNPNNFCYLNAALQGLNALDFFTEQIKKNGAGVFYPDDTIPHAFCDFITALETGNYENELKKLDDIVASTMGAISLACGQQDASEFVTKLLSEFIHSTETPDFPAIVGQLFYSNNQPYVKCPVPGSNKEIKHNLTSEDLLVLNIAMLPKDDATLEELFNNYTRERSITYKKQACTQFNSFKLAPLLIINLKRYAISPQGMTKISRPVKAPLNAKFNNDNYELKAVIVHSGDVSAGHYIAYVKEANKWWKCDDASVTEVTVLELVRKISDGYDFFYQSTTKPVIQPIQPGQGPEKQPKQGPAQPGKGPAQQPAQGPVGPSQPSQPSQGPVGPAHGPAKPVSPLGEALDDLSGALKSLTTALSA